MTRIGGFVIHRNAMGTLRPCLESLRAVCDDVVAVDSGSTDGSAELAGALGVRRVCLPWEGFGAARARGAASLLDGPARPDVVFYLDSDEWLEPAAVERILDWKRAGPSGSTCALPRRDWVAGEGHRWLFRTEWRRRLVRAERATWAPHMVVHEALPEGGGERLDAPIEHHFWASAGERAGKDERYALLWAVQAHLEGRRPKPGWVEQAAHLLKAAVGTGAVFRGGAAALGIAWQVSTYHRLKHRYLKEVRQGGHRAVVQALREGRYAEVYTLVERTFMAAGSPVVLRPAAGG